MEKRYWNQYQKEIPTVPAKTFTFSFFFFIFCFPLFFSVLGLRNQSHYFLVDCNSNSFLSSCIAFLTFPTVFTFTFRIVFILDFFRKFFLFKRCVNWHIENNRSFNVFFFGIIPQRRTNNQSRIFNPLP